MRARAGARGGWRAYRRRPFPPSERRVARELHVGQAHVAIDHLIRTDGQRSFKTESPTVGDEIVLVDSVAADAETADEFSVAIESRATREENDSALLVVRCTRLRALRAGICDILQEQVEEWTGLRAIDSRGIERHGAEADGAVGYGGAHGNIGQI